MLPNFLSIFRMIAFLPVIILFLAEFYLTSFILFSSAAGSDFLDGYLARKYNLTSNLGSLLDLVADKILVSSILVFFVFQTGDFYLFILSLLIILREISISSLRLFLVSNGMEISKLTPDKYGKFKTFVQMFSIAILLTGETGNTLINFQDYNAQTIGIVLLWLSAFLTLYTGYDYLRKGIDHAISEDEKS